MPLALVDFKGLVSSVGRELRAKEACTEANNVLFDAPGVIRKRRGFARMRSGTDLNSNESFYGLFYTRALGTSIIAHTGPGDSGSAQADTLQYGDGTGLLTPIALDTGVSVLCLPDVADESSLNRTQHFYAATSHYFTGTTGVVRVDTATTGAPSGGARYAGQPNGQGPNLYQMAVYNVLTGGAGGFLPADSACAYRVTWHRRLASGIELGGAPTGRTTVRNINGTSGWVAATAQNVTLRIRIPPAYGTSTGAATTAWYWKLWRTRVFAPAQGDPDDEFFQVAQGTLSAGDIANTYAAVTDNTPDAFLLGQPALHTNAIAYPVGEANNVLGQLNSDSPPPVAQAVAYWQDVAWYAAPIEPKADLWQMLALPSDGDTISIGGSTVTFRTAPGAGEVQIVTTLGSLTLNIEATTRNLVDQYNINATGSALLYYVSIGSSAPGQFLVASKLPTQAGGTVSPSVPARWLQMSSTMLALPAQNTLAFSKAGRPDAVAPQNRLVAGGVDTRIMRMVPVQEALIVFTTTGAYRVTGSSWADFEVQPFEGTYRLMAPQLVAAVDDRCYAWCYEGIIEFWSGGARPVSLAIEPTLADIRRAATTPKLANAGFAVGYSAAHRVQFFYPDVSTADKFSCRNWLTYDTRTEAWSTGSFESANYAVSAGVVRSSGTADDVLIIGSYNYSGAGCYLLAERQTFSATADYVDDGLPNLSVASSNVSAEMYWKFLSASQDIRAHWQQVVMQLEGNEFSWLTPDPAGLSLSVRFDSDLVTTPASTTIADPTPFKRVLRLETPRDFRRANQLGLRIVAGGASFFGLVGLSIGMGDVSRWAK